ncbi:mitochondrial protein [Pholiota conissans]|uniref:Mitochondrial protein n=1 Tax=Pholiota conissans TaxID=109636 RepID=A0A9P6CY69_9AGAR|nr:mitochondrial protein [Pholiota conissans]
MNSAVGKILVVGGNGFIGSAVCKAALARGVQVTSVSSSGRPYRTPKGHSPAWTSKVNWKKGDALNPQTFADLLAETDGVVHTLGTLIENSSYKRAVEQGNLPTLIGSVFESLLNGDGNPLHHKPQSENLKSYEVMNRDSALRVCEAFLSVGASADWSANTPRPFIYISAEDIFRPIIPARYIKTKREAEQGIGHMMFGKSGYRSVFMRPSLVYHAHLRPLTTPAAALLDLSATIHRILPRGIPTPSNILRSLGSSQQSTTQSSFEGDVDAESSFISIANALTIPPIHVDHVADAICVALDSRNDVRGVVGVSRMRELIGWSAGGRGQSGGVGLPES